MRSVAVASVRGSRIARPVRDEDPVRFRGEDRLGGSRARHDGHLAADVDQMAKDVPFHPEIEGDNVRPARVECASEPARRRPRVRPGRRCTRNERSRPSSHVVDSFGITS